MSSFTNEEIASMVETKRRLEEQGIPVSRRELAVVCLSSNLKTEDAVEKYKKWLESMKSFGIDSFDDIWNDVKGDGTDEDGLRLVAPQFATFAGCGRDVNDHSILWIRKHAVLPDEEKVAIRANCIFFMAVVADIKSMREGITFVLDTTESDSAPAAIGNESKLQQARRSMPLKSDKVFIMGASFFKRFFLNSIFVLAGLNVRFAELSDVKAVVPDESLPVYAGGNGGGIVTSEDLYQWVKSRLAIFPDIPAEL